MGTRCQVQVHRADGEIVKTLYHHWDGYPEHMMPLLEAAKDSYALEDEDRASGLTAIKLVNYVVAEDPGGYDRIRDDDRISLLGLSGLAPGTPVSCIIKHADGAQETLNLRHTLNQGQIEWFKAGSAMNHMKNLEAAGS